MSMMKPVESYRFSLLSCLVSPFILIFLLAMVSCSVLEQSQNNVISKQEKSPHIPEDETTCFVCHKKDSVEKGKPEKILASDIEVRCTSCHNSLTSVHYLGINPFTDPLALQQYTSPEKILADDQASCIACHSPHAAENNNRYRLTKEYLRLATIARSINPHRQQPMCLSCHSTAPVAGQPNLAKDGNINALCNHCHASGFARKEIHPVGIIPSKHIRIPPDMPLQNGLLTCETCHQSSLQPGNPCQSVADKKENKRFLRGGKLSRSDFCFLCHIEETYKRLNAHLQLDEQGQIKEKTCLFCHATRPDINILGLNQVVFLVDDINVPCMGCHSGFEVKHPSGGNHLREPKGKILQGLKTAIDRIGVELPLYNGKIVCATCHNPHQDGVIKINAAAAGSQRKNKLRLLPGSLQCTGCHWDR
jgi:predicted CXXCH cytochrome family protein